MKKSPETANSAAANRVSGYTEAPPEATIRTLVLSGDTDTAHNHYTLKDHNACHIILPLELKYSSVREGCEKELLIGF
jgi:hypothetical protein